MVQVQLAVYDLSQGMARLLFSQLCPDNGDVQLDCIPHTALLVYGKEYFFGSGIQIVEDIPQFRSTMGMHPFQILDLGCTNVTRHEFELWLQQQSSSSSNTDQNSHHQYDTSEWASSTYDLFHHNCNHFSHTAALQGLHLPNGIPDWILQVPSKVLSTPLGRQLQPFLQQMSGSGGNAFGMSPMAPPPVTAAHSSFEVRSFSATTTTASASSLAATTYNPWTSSAYDNGGNDTKLPPPAAPVSGNTVASITASSPFASSSRSSINSSSSSASPSPSMKAPSTPILDSYNQPLVSNNTQSVRLCIQKLQQYDPHHVLQAESILNYFEKSNDNSPPINVKPILQICTNVMEDNSNNNKTTYALMLLRLIVLMNCDDDNDIMQWMQTYQHELLDDSASSTTTATAMVYCIWSNMISAWKNKTTQSSSFYEYKNQILEWMLQYVLRDATSMKNNHQLQQAALCVLYNISWWKSMPITHTDDDDDEMDEITVTLICTIVQNLMDEMISLDDSNNDDQMTTFRQLILIGRLMISHIHVIELIHDLGLLDVLHDWIERQERSIRKKHNEKCIAVAKELEALMLNM